MKFASDLLSITDDQENRNINVAGCQCVRGTYFPETLEKKYRLFSHCTAETFMILRS